MTAPVSSIPPRARQTVLACAVAMTACALVVGGTPTAAYAQGLLPNPNPVGNTITINTTIFNNAVLPPDVYTNKGTIEILDPGQLINVFILDNSDTGVINNNYFLFNHGTLNNTGAGVINNNYTQVNYGTLNNTSAAIINNSSVLANQIDPLTLSPVTLNNDGILNNTGELANYSYISSGGNLVISSIINAGILRNAHASSLYNEGLLRNSGVVENAGTISNGGDISLGVIENLGSLAEFTNSGQLQNFTQLTNAKEATLTIAGTGYLTNIGKLYNTQDARLINNGGLSNSGDLDNSAVLVNNYIFSNLGLLSNNGSGQLTNAAGAVLANEGTLSNEYGSTLINAVDETDPTKFGVINNYGAVNNSGIFSNYGTLINSYLIIPGTAEVLPANLTNKSGALLENHGLLLNEAYGSVNNEGTLRNYGNYSTGVNSPVGGPLVNSGILENYGQLSVLAFDNTTGGTLTNAATAVLEFLGGTIRNAVDATLSNFGNISGRLYTSIENSGILNNNPFARIISSGALTNESTGTLTNGPHAVLENHGTMTNHNTILNDGLLYNRGRADNYVSIINNNSFTNYGTFTNAAGAVVSGEGTYIQMSGLTRNDGTMTQSCFDIRGGSVVGNGEFNSTCLAGMNLAAGTLLSAGNSPGKITINGNLTSGADMLFEIAGTASGKYDVLDINGAAEFLGGLITIEFIDGYLPGLDDTFNFIVADSSIGWDKLKWAVTGLGADFEWNIAYGNGGAYIDITAVPGTGTAPEPGTYALVLAGLGLMGFMSRRRRALAV